MTHTNNIRIIKYEVGQFIKDHSDITQNIRGSLTINLNDDYEGGEIVIADIMYKPEKGSAIIFPSNFMFPHYVDRVTKGERYSIITWLM